MQSSRLVIPLIYSQHARKQIDIGATTQLLRSSEELGTHLPSGGQRESY